MLNIVSEGHLRIQSGFIYYQVIEGSDVGNAKQDYVLFMQGGPGFSFEHLKPEIELMARIAKKKSLAMPRFILFDPFGCGKSSAPSDYERQCTVANYAEVAAQVAELIRLKMGPDPLSLIVAGASFGSMEAMMIPAVRPQWPNADVNLRLIISERGIISSECGEQSVAYVKQHYPNNQRLIAAAEQLARGDFPNLVAYEKFLLDIAPAYSIEEEKPARSMQRAILRAFPTGGARVLSGLRSLMGKLHLQAGFEYFDSLLDYLTGCNIKILSHFFGRKFDGFNLPVEIEKLKPSYEKIPIFITGNTFDHIAQANKNAAIIHQQCLPNSSALVVYNDRHTTRTTDKAMHAEIFITLANHLTPDWSQFKDINVTTPAHFLGLLAKPEVKTSPHYAIIHDPAILQPVTSVATLTSEVKLDMAHPAPDEPPAPVRPVVESMLASPRR